MRRLELSVLFAWLAPTAYTTRAQSTPAEAVRVQTNGPEVPVFTNYDQSEAR